MALRLVASSRFHVGVDAELAHLLGVLLQPLGRDLALLDLLCRIGLFADANPRPIQRFRGSPQYLMWPALNFSVRCRCPVSLPAITTRQPFAPASMIRRTVEWPARRKCHPRSRALASFSAMICAFSAG